MYLSNKDGTIAEMWAVAHNSDAPYFGKDWNDLTCGSIDRIGAALRAQGNVVPKSTYLLYDEVAHDVYKTLYEIYDSMCRLLWHDDKPAHSRISIVHTPAKERGLCGCIVRENEEPRIVFFAEKLAMSKNLATLVLREVMVFMARAVFRIYAKVPDIAKEEELWRNTEIRRLGFVGRELELVVLEDSPMALFYRLFGERHAEEKLRFKKMLKAYESCTQEERQLIDYEYELIMYADYWA